jgi:hypothetical protein
LCFGGIGPPLDTIWRIQLHYRKQLIWVALLAFACNAPAQTLRVFHYKGVNKGAQMAATYDLGKDWKNSCCSGDSIRFLQRVTYTSGGTTKSFIDPPPTTEIKTSNGKTTTDNLPWYDGTYTSWQNYKDGPLTNQNFGAGPIIVDTPGGWPAGTDWLAQTLIVCVTGANTAMFLGGYSWGFDVTDVNAAATLKTVTSLTCTDALLTQFNDSLNAATWGDPKNPTKWQISACANGDCPAFNVQMGGGIPGTPAPCAALPMLVGALALAKRKRDSARTASAKVD